MGLWPWCWVCYLLERERDTQNWQKQHKFRERKQKSPRSFFLPPLFQRRWSERGCSSEIILKRAAKGNNTFILISYYCFVFSLTILYHPQVLKFLCCLFFESRLSPSSYRRTHHHHHQSPLGSTSILSSTTTANYFSCWLTSFAPCFLAKNPFFYFSFLIEPQKSILIWVLQLLAKTEF